MSFTQRVADYFTARPNQWIDGEELAMVAGRYAWRSRVSDCRVKLGMVIENRQRTGPNGGYVVSEYRYVPPVPVGRDGGLLFEVHQRNG